MTYYGDPTCMNVDDDALLTAGRPVNLDFLVRSCPKR